MLVSVITIVARRSVEPLYWNCTGVTGVGVMVTAIVRKVVEKKFKDVLDGFYEGAIA